MKRETISYLRIYTTRGLNNPQYICPKCGSCQIYQLITKVKKYLDNNTLILGDFNLALSILDRSSKQNISKEMRALNDTLDQIEFTDIYRTLHPQLNTHSSQVQMELSPE